MAFRSRQLATLAIAIAIILLQLLLLIYGTRNIEKSDVSWKGGASSHPHHKGQRPFGFLPSDAKIYHGSLVDYKSIQKNGNAMFTRDEFRKKFFGAGYAPGGGGLPADDHKLYPDPRTWGSIDNGTCLDVTKEPMFDWQKRAPYAILLGAMKGGTHALSEYLWGHPRIVRPAGRAGYELHFMDGKHFKRNETGISQRENQVAYADRFRRMYPGFFVPDEEDLVTIHDSPRYLLWSDRIPDSILCVVPWAKLMAVLRDPVERAVSHYRFQDEARRQVGVPMVDWEKWIEDDLRLLRRAGVVQDWDRVDFDEFAGSDAEFKAWKTYLRNPNSQMILGRGLYAIQIGHYFAAMDKAGKPRSDFLAIQSEALRSNTQKEYNRVLDFLDLAPHNLSDLREIHQTSGQAAALPGDLRNRLERFFEPYNQRLYELLGWDNVWRYE